MKEGKYTTLAAGEVQDIHTHPSYENALQPEMGGWEGGKTLSTWIQVSNSSGQTSKSNAALSTSGGTADFTALSALALLPLAAHHDRQNPSPGSAGVDLTPMRPTLFVLCVCVCVCVRARAVQLS